MQCVTRQSHVTSKDLRERSKPRELQEHEDEGQSLPGRWVNSHELRAGDCIITRSGTHALITEIRQRIDDAFPVSNLSIIGHHNYAVGDVGVLVHNITVCEETLKELRELYANGKGKSLDELRDLLRSKKNDKGERLYNEDEIDKAMGKILNPDPRPIEPSADAIDRAKKKSRLPLLPEPPDAYKNRAKPPYETNPAHEPGSNFNPRKDIEPPDASEVYDRSVRTGMGEWHGIGKDGKVYRFFYDNAGKVHFSGAFSPLEVSKAVRKALGI